ncbi:hypothetical protein AMTR_s00002p00238730 [Amborella trichopoda]|uniref:Uncharacterized protein n=1 Tax=Amborella trichopoda TaxID=13333 RepID=W1NZX3_AMBTC|nr:hypothetical protein AMTR_s00002p00238730 [Amborella trichopoda]
MEGERVRRAEQGRRLPEDVMAGLFLVVVVVMVVIGVLMVYILYALLSLIVLAFCVWYSCVIWRSPRNDQQLIVECDSEILRQHLERWWTF